MKNRERDELIVAALIGALAAAGATLIIRSARPPRRSTLLEEIEPLRQAMVRRLDGAGRGAREIGRRGAGEARRAARALSRS
jgi:hypothetical protein